VASFLENVIQVSINGNLYVKYRKWGPKEFEGIGENSSCFVCGVTYSLSPI